MLRALVIAGTAAALSVALTGTAAADPTTEPGGSVEVCTPPLAPPMPPQRCVIVPLPE